ncbi:MAG: hypothetical protein ACYS19_11340, partial [Planctomycetota bacterium]
LPPKNNSNTRRASDFAELIWLDRTVTELKKRNPHDISRNIESPHIMKINNLKDKQAKLDRQ